MTTSEPRSRARLEFFKRVGGRQRGLRRRVGNWWGGLSEPRQILAVWVLVITVAVALGFWSAAGGGIEPPDVPFRDVAVGRDHTCGLRIDGRVACWGLNENGQAEVPEDAFRTIAVGGDKSCGLLADGSVKCWGGSNWWHPKGAFNTIAIGPEGVFCGLRAYCSLECEGKFADDSDPPTGPFRALSVGESQACGLRADGTLACWGVNFPPPIDPPPGLYSSVSAGLGYSCGVRVNRTVVCWGRLAQPTVQERGGPFSVVAAGEYHACGLRANQTIDCWSTGLFSNLVARGLTVAPGGQFSAVSVERHQSCGLRINGAIECWGLNPLLDDNGNPLYAQTPLNTPQGRFSAVSVDSDHACGLRANNTIACWGDNDDGQTNAPKGEFSAVSVGSDHACGLRADGAIECWGSNRSGQIDAPEGEFSTVAAGGVHACGLRADGDIICWGYSDRYDTMIADWDGVCWRYADGSRQCRSYERELVDALGEELDDFRFVDIAASGYKTCGLRANGAVVCWDDQSDIYLPTRNFKTVSISGSFGCGLRSDDSIECWNYDTTVQQPLPPEGPFSAIATNWSHSCGVRAEDGTLECWGLRDFDMPTPSGQFQAVSVDYNYACGIHADGTIICWGDEPPVEATPDGVHWTCNAKWWTRWLYRLNTCR